VTATGPRSPHPGDTWPELIEAGQRLVAGASTPFLLHDPGAVWLVDKGKVDVFFTRIAGGEQVSQRRYVFTVSAGGLILGLAPPEGDSGWGLIGAGFPETEVYRLDRAQFMAIVGRDTAAGLLPHLVDQWVQTLTRGIAPPFTPREFLDIPLGREFQAGRRAFIRPRSEVLWFRHLRGSSLYLSNANLLLHARDPFIPLCRDIWLETQDDDNAFLAMTTTDCLHQPETIWESLSALGGMVLECLVLDVLERSERELAKAQDRQELDRQQMETVMRDLASVLKTGREELPALDPAADPLFAACSLVGEWLGLEMAPVPRAAREARGCDPLEEIARASHSRVRAVTLQGKWWRREGGPLLASVTADGRPVALLPVRRNRYDLADPATQTRTPVTARVAATLDPVAFTFTRTFPRRLLQFREVLAFASRGAWPDARNILLVGLLGGLLGTALPVAMGIIMDTIIPAAARGPLFHLGLGLMAAAVAALMFQVVSAIGTLRLQVRLDVAMQGAVWDRLLELPMTFFRQFSGGDLTLRASSFNQIRQQLTGATGATLLSCLFSVFSFGLLFYYSPRLALVAAVLVAISITLTTWVSHFNLNYQKKILASSGKITGHVLQLITGIAKLRVAGAEMRAYAFWARLFSGQRRLAFRAENLNNAFQVFNLGFGTICTLTIYALMALSLSGALVPAGGTAGERAATPPVAGVPLSTGSFIAFMAAFGQFLSAMSQLGGVLSQVLGIVPLYQRARPILQTAPEVETGQADPGELSGEIEVNSLSFRYDENGPDILKNITLRARPGEFIAVVGPSGSGKSTLFRLLLGFEKPHSGAIYFDGKDLAELDRQRLRRQFGVVLQNGRVLSGNILDNIIGASRLTVDDAWEAAGMAGLAEDIRRMPMGMHTFITEGGGTLSGGQRQRLLIARALAFKPRIILFDEATSALDNVTQAAVSESLARLDATRIVIAHRLSTIEKADVIYVIQEGAVVEQGRYDELMRRDGVFAQLARRQLV